MDSDGEDDTPPLLLAAYAGDAHALRRAIADGADLHVEDEENYTALHWLVNNTPQGLPARGIQRGRPGCEM